MNPRILVTVSRQWSYISTMREVLAKVYAEQPTAVLVHGDCPQGDRLAATIWKRLGGAEEKWPADWSKGNGGGPLRNARMVESNPDLVLSFIRGNSRGATGTCNLAVGAGLNCVPPYRQED
ncbi:SLOG family protein [Lentzea atacamensis]|uniref:SLOG family protein n=1 Tax=Lentzea atacamensis TaxID=531938 RepID=UPI000D6D43E5|nr:SLOG family protein [Lentzea atacamensis]